jgi:hypothetical protein
MGWLLSGEAWEPRGRFERMNAQLLQEYRAFREPMGPAPTTTIFCFGAIGGRVLVRRCWAMSRVPGTTLIDEELSLTSSVNHQTTLRPFLKARNSRRRSSQGAGDQSTSPCSSGRGTFSPPRVTVTFSSRHRHRTSWRRSPPGDMRACRARLTSQE